MKRSPKTGPGQAWRRSYGTYKITKIPRVHYLMNLQNDVTLNCGDIFARLNKLVFAMDLGRTLHVGILSLQVCEEKNQNFCDKNQNCIQDCISPVVADSMHQSFWYTKCYSLWNISLKLNWILKYRDLLARWMESEL